MRQCSTKIITSILLVTFLATSVLSGVLLLPLKARAQLGGAVIESGPLTATTVTNKLQLTFWQGVMTTLLSAVMNTVTMATQQFAFDLASGLASAVKGENPVAFLNDWQSYLTQMGQDAAGEFIGTLSADWSKSGLNLCTPRLPNIALSIQLGLAQRFTRPTPKCDWTQIANNWESLAREVTNPIQLLGHVSLGFQPGASDLSQASIALEAMKEKQSASILAGTKTREEGQGIKSIDNIISGNIQTPATYTKAQLQTLADQSASNKAAVQNVQTGALATAVIGGGAWAALGNTLLSTFTNTLASKLLKIGLEGLFKSLAPGQEKSIDLNSLVAQNPTGGAAAAKALYSSLITPDIKTGSLDIVSEFSSCPDDKSQTPSVYQCTIDEKFAQALRQAQSGTALSVKEAIDKGYLDATKPFGFINNGGVMEPSYRDGYGLSNLKKLRLARVLPIGWELAALKVKELMNTPSPKNYYTLGEVMAGFNDPSNKDFYKLVDPSWILKVPPTQCGAKVFSNLVADNGYRLDYCADVKHCVSEDSRGNCLGWGYCLNEKNTWRFKGDKCDGQFASCETYQNVSQNSQQVSFLENTLNFGVCTADNAGCREYSRAGQPETSGEWKDTPSQWSTEDKDKIYLNSQAAACKPEAAGCAEFLVADQSPSYLKKPPSWLNCDGEDNQPADCDNYARVCRDTEVGCESYQPKNGDPLVPGVVTAQDYCPAECVGYAAFSQEQSNFEPRIPQVFLIPTSATACDLNNAGCSEFTNLTTEAREYYSSLRACQKPTATAASPGTDGTYYTWEGKETTGYQLRTWSLKVSNVAGVSGTDKLVAGKENNPPPCTNVAVPSDISLAPDCLDMADNQAICSAADLTGVNPNPDCRAFYDKDGNIFYRLYSLTVVVSDQCQKYRLTGQDALFTENLCAQYGGSWNDDNKQCGLSKQYTTVDEYYCQASRGTWDATKKDCFFAGLPSGSSACPATANSCRLFKGNNSANVKITLPLETFENGNQWFYLSSSNKPTTSSESVFFGGYSLKIETGEALRPLSELNQGASYLLSFWAKAGTSGAAIKARLADYGGTNGAQTGTQDFSDAKPAANDWQPMTFGPLELNFANNFISDKRNSSQDDKIGPELILQVAGPDISQEYTVFIDNLVLRQVQEELPLLKNFLFVPDKCNQDNNGNNVPQFMAGCAEYTDSQGNPAHLKSFSNFCRPKSIGCQALTDTFNNSLKPEGVNTTSTGALTKDNVIKPAHQTVYLVADDKKKCTEENRGCEALGLQKADGTWQTIYKLNNPDKYNTTSGAILCAENEAGCDAWTSTGGSAYFKDPSNQLCEWRDNVSLGGVKYAGWFKKFSTAPLGSPGRNLDQATCAKLNQKWNPDKKQCFPAQEPCYGSVILTGSGNSLNLAVDVNASYLSNGVFGLWRNSDTNKYNGQVGECPKTQATCTEFVDPTDKPDAYPAGQPYYYLDNNNLDRASCQGQVSRINGCALFNQTDVPEKNWNAEDSYKNSDDLAQGGLVQPTEGATQVDNNANVILKVQRDRVCGQWLACRSWMTDPSGNVLCTYYGRCQQIGLGENQPEAPSCKKWLTNPPLTGLSASLGNDPLSQKNYTDNRTASENSSGGAWSYQDFSGYTFPNLRPVEQLREFVGGQNTDTCDVAGGHCLASKRPCQNDNDCGEPVLLASYQSGSSSQQNNISSQSPSSCANDSDCGKGYICENSLCVVPKSCRGYPAVNAPLATNTGLAENQQVVACTQGNCECSYAEYHAGGATAYYPLGRAVNLICSQGDTDQIGRLCQIDTDCKPGANPDEVKNYCSSISSFKRYNGWRGYCLDFDQEKTMGANSPVGGEPIQACLAWAPIALPQGEYSAFAQAPGAQFTVNPGRDWYCVDKETEKTMSNLSTDLSNLGVPTTSIQTTGLGFSQTLYRGLDCARSSNNWGDDDKEGPERYYCAADEGSSYGVNPNNNIKNINNFFDEPVFKNGDSIGSLGDNLQHNDCNHGGADTKGQWCAVAREGDTYYVRGNVHAKGKSLSNFLGCYHLADDDANSTDYSNANVIFYPYKHAYDIPIYAAQIKSVDIVVNGNVHNSDPSGPLGDILSVASFYAGASIPAAVLNKLFGSALFDVIGTAWNCSDQGGVGCEDIIPENCGALGSGKDDWRFYPNCQGWVFHLSGSVPSEVERKDKWYWKDSHACGEGKIIMAAKFDKDGRFLGIEMEAHDSVNEGGFAVTDFSMSFKPGCKTLVRVANPGDTNFSPAPYTDNLYQGKAKTGVDRGQQCEPFGAAGLSSKQFITNVATGDITGYSGLVLPSDDLAKTASNKMCVENYAYVHDGVGNFTEEFFANLSEKIDLKQLSHGNVNFDDEPYGLSYNLSLNNSNNDKRSSGTPPKISEMKINGLGSGNINISSTVYPITLTFFGSPNANQMPIRQITVDWDDNTPDMSVGDGKESSFKARALVCDNSDFAHSQDACSERPFSFSHVYFCDSSNWNSATKTCSFKPRARILDNWGLGLSTWKDYSNTIIMKPPATP